MIPADLEERILRLHHVEKWTVGTIAKQCGVHHTTVRRVLHDRVVDAPATNRPSMVEPFLPFIHETFEKWPTLPASRLHLMLVERGYRGSEGASDGCCRACGPASPPRPTSGCAPSSAKRPRSTGATSARARSAARRGRCPPS